MAAETSTRAAPPNPAPHAPNDPPAAAGAKDPSMPINLRPAAAIAFVDGPSVEDGAAALAFLQQEARDPSGGRRMLRVPVAIRFDGPGKLMIDAAAIGVDHAALGVAALGVELDDSAMGVGLLDQLRSACERSATTCAVWLHVHWGPNLPMPPLPPIPGAPPPAPTTLAVRAFEALIGPGVAASSARVGVAR